MGLFRRKPRGRHALGAAVTGIPSAPVVAPVAAPVAVPSAEPDLLTSIAQLIASGEAWNEPAPAAVVAPAHGVVAPSAAPPQSPPSAFDGATAVASVDAPEVPTPVALLGGATASAPADRAENIGLPSGAAEPPAPLSDDPLSLPALEPEPIAPLHNHLTRYGALFAEAPLTDTAPAFAVSAEDGVRPEPAQASLPPVPDMTALDTVLLHAELELQAQLDQAPPPAGPRPAPAPDGMPAGSTPLAAAPQAFAVPVQAGPRVQLGFRDGTTASLDPDSEQALALAELSEMLNARD